VKAGGTSPAIPLAAQRRLFEAPLYQKAAARSLDFAIDSEPKPLRASFPASNWPTRVLEIELLGILEIQNPKGQFAAPRLFRRAQRV